MLTDLPAGVTELNETLLVTAAAAEVDAYDSTCGDGGSVRFDMPSLFSKGFSGCFSEHTLTPFTLSIFWPDTASRSQTRFSFPRILVTYKKGRHLTIALSQLWPSSPARGMNSQSAGHRLLQHARWQTPHHSHRGCKQPCASSASLLNVPPPPILPQGMTPEQVWRARGVDGCNRQSITDLISLVDVAAQPPSLSDLPWNLPRINLHA